MTARKLLSALLLTLLAVVTVAGPAHAGNPSPQVVTDPAGDGAGRGDLRAVRVAQNGGPLTLQVRTQQGVDLDDAASWNSGTSKTQLRFFANSTGDSDFDFSVILRATALGPVYEITGFEMAPRGDCVVITQPQATLIRLVIQLSCIPGVSAVGVYARYRFDAGGDGTVNSVDRGPNSGYTPVLDFTL